MTTPLTKIYNVFLHNIDDDILALLSPEVVEDMLLIYLQGACVEFTTCKKDLTIDLETNTIASELDADEIFILSRGMIMFWLQPKILREDTLRNMITDKDYNQSSPANMLDKLIKLKKLTEDDLIKRRRKYTYKNFMGFE